MSKLKIYGVAQSRTSRVLWLVQELGIDYEHVPVSFSSGELRKPEYLALNPNARIPIIQDGDLVLWESLAINLYLAKKHGRGLWPATPGAEAKAVQWTLWATTECEPSMQAYSMHTSFLPAEKRKPEEAAAALKKLERPFSAIESVLAAQKYLLGDTFTVADLNVANVLNRARQMDLSATPKLKAWLDSCFGRSAWAAVEKMRAAA
jgi:glutathione S-transferase